MTTGSDLPAGWRLINQRACSWYESPSHAAGASLLSRIAGSADIGQLPDVDIRARGVRVRMAPDAAAVRAVTAAADDLGLAADPTALAELGYVIEATDPAALEPFWQTVLDYRRAPGSSRVGSAASGETRLIDPLRRDPTVSFRRLDEPRPANDRLHLDVGRLPEAVLSTRQAIDQQPRGPYGVLLTDAEGNEVDLCPGDALSPDTEDWQTMFSALACYPTPSSEVTTGLVTAVTQLADQAGLSLLIDVRPEAVVIDSAKDQWEGPEGADPAFVELAARVQGAARAAGVTADPGLSRFLQLGIAGRDITRLRSFWSGVLGYVCDPRPPVTDIYDPRRLNPVIFFQDLDPTEEDRARQRNRLHVSLAVPPDRVPSLMASAVEAGGRIVENLNDQGRCTLADPEGNEIRVTGS
ncbi:VOC family protein [Microlunatus sp. Gsoil 973]|uniref:VOC family protein n=1 Tax=Microlunatus sp. Gsoil 973 TaxID=2672569 RepID=UPI0012B46258|nr:VOC family protein [Microlunatus sp. Gsoil 973]QGN32135.1 hypothetical protein GJV80_04260 [Microlunatus sp. Gsoil 973]